MITYDNDAPAHVIACDICMKPLGRGSAGVWWADRYDKETWELAAQQGPWFCHGSSYRVLHPCHFAMMARLAQLENDGWVLADIDFTDFQRAVKQ